MKAISDALELLTAQHDDITARLDAVENLSGESLAHALGELADKITTHLVVEAELCSRLQLVDPGDADQIHESLARMFATEVDTAEMREAIRDLDDVFVRHAAKQDQGTFIALAENIQPTVLEQLGERLSKLTDETAVVLA